MSPGRLTAVVVRTSVILLCLAGEQGCGGGTIGQGVDAISVVDSGTEGSKCPGGEDRDDDGYGKGCPAGDDCDDSDPLTYPGANEACDGKDNDCDDQTDEGTLNSCGTCDTGCDKVGDKPFPLDPTQDPGVKDANGVGLDSNGDLVLDKTKKNFNYMWIANSLDTIGAAGGCEWATKPGYDPSKDPLCRGTISKIDTASLKEAARYFTLTCKSKPGATGCVDLHGKQIDKDFAHTPSRTAVDYNFDVWVANRAFGGQPSATKIANDSADCIDRNNNGTIETSADNDGDGKIQIDCDGDGAPDSGSTVCTGAYAGKAPEFYGDDDECILFTVNYGDPSDCGRSVCLDAGIGGGASNAWVGTFSHTSGATAANRYYKIDGKTGALSGPYPIATGHKVYGCVVDSKRILWSTDSDLGATLTYLDTTKPTQVGPLLTPPWGTPSFYGITVDSNNHIWLGGWDSGQIYRYKPDRTSFATLSKGTWTGLKYPAIFDYSRGIAADLRGKIWVAIHVGYIWRADQSVTDGLHDLSSSTSYWPTKGAEVVGVGVDFAGHVWGISYMHHVASRLDVDSKGDPLQPPTSTTKNVPVGMNPYTYSDFTGYGLQNFTRPQGRYLYQLEPCSKVKAKWNQVSWSAKTPSGTSITVRVRSGDSEATMGSWFGPYKTSPALLGKSAKPLVPNPSKILQVEFTLQTTMKDTTPILHDFSVAYSCTQIPG